MRSQRVALPTRLMNQQKACCGTLSSFMSKFSDRMSMYPTTGAWGFPTNADIAKNRWKGGKKRSPPCKMHSGSYSPARSTPSRIEYVKGNQAKQNSSARMGTILSVPQCWTSAWPLILGRSCDRIASWNDNRVNNVRDERDGKQDAHQDEIINTTICYPIVLSKTHSRLQIAS
jgi:hypothetical protein